MSCIACGSVQTVAVLEMESLPVFCNVASATAMAARSVKRANLDLRYCSDCTHLFNSQFDEQLVEYTGEYENALDHSQRFRDYAAALASQLVEHYDLKGKHLVELGCGQGEFLRSLCHLGENSGDGFDPGYRGPSVVGKTSFSTAPFSPDDCSQRADFICCRHMLEHLANPVAYLKNIRSGLSSPEQRVFFEVPNSLYTLREMGIWDLIYEHVSYFSERSLTTVFELAGFNVCEVGSAYEGQFLTIVAKPCFSASPAAQTQQTGAIDELEDLVEKFAMRFEEKLAGWQGQLAHISDCKKTAVVWGGGSKGVTFLNLVNDSGAIGSVVDINPLKTGKFTAGAALPFVAPEQLLDNPPDVVIVMNNIYRSEIASMLKSLSLFPELLVA